MIEVSLIRQVDSAAKIRHDTAAAAYKKQIRYLLIQKSAKIIMKNRFIMDQEIRH